MQKGTQDTTSFDEINDTIQLHQLTDDDSTGHDVGATAKNDDSASMATIDVKEGIETRECVINVGTSEQFGLFDQALEQADIEVSSPTATHPVTMTETDEVVRASLDPPSARAVRVEPAQNTAPAITQRRVLGDWASQEEDEIFNQQIKAVSPSWEGALQLSPRFPPRAHSFQEEGQTNGKETEQTDYQAEDQDERQYEEHDEEHDEEHAEEHDDEAADERAVDVCRSTFSDSSSEESLSDLVEQAAQPMPTLGEATSQTPIELDQDKVETIDNARSKSPRKKNEGFLEFDDHLKTFRMNTKPDTSESAPDLKDAERKRQWRRESLQTQGAMGLRRPKRPPLPRSSLLRRKLNSGSLSVILEESSEQASPRGPLKFTDSEYENLFTHEAVPEDVREVCNDYGVDNFAADMHSQADKWQERAQGSQVPRLIRQPSRSEQEHDGYEGQFTQGPLYSSFPDDLDLPSGHHVSLPQGVETHRKGHRKDHRRTQSAPIHSFDYTNTSPSRPDMEGQKRLMKNAAGNRREYWSHRLGVSLTDFKISIESITPFFEEDANLYKWQAFQTTEALKKLEKASEDIETLIKVNEELKTNKAEAPREEVRLRELQMRLVEQVRENKILKDEKGKVEANYKQLITCYEDADEEKTGLQQELRRLKANMSEVPLRKDSSVLSSVDDGQSEREEVALTDRPEGVVTAPGSDVTRDLTKQSSLLTEKENEVLELTRAKAQLEDRLRTNVEEQERTKRDMKQAVERAARLDEQIHLKSQRQHAQLEKQMQQAQERTQVLLEEKETACEKRLEDEWSRHQDDIARLSADHENYVVSLQAANEAMQVELRSLTLTHQGNIQEALEKGRHGGESKTRAIDAQFKDDYGFHAKDETSSVRTHGQTLVSADRIRRLKMLYAPIMVHKRAERISNVLTSIELEQKKGLRRLELVDQKHRYAQDRKNRQQLLQISSLTAACKR